MRSERIHVRAGRKYEERLTIIPMPKQKFFTVSQVSREDLAELGYDAKDVTDGQMQVIADKMGESFCESMAYWDALGVMAEHLKVPLTST